MPDDFAPIMSVLQEPQRRLWNELGAVPKSFVLYGGTALALQLGHRTSIDFDLIGTSSFDPQELYDSIPFLAGATLLQQAASTLTCVVDRGGPVQISFFGVPRVKRLAKPLIAGNGLAVAPLIDLAGVKVALVQKRAEAKDYLDIDALLRSGKVSLPTALAAAKAIYGESYSPELSLKALAYYGDGNLPKLPQPVRDRLAAAVAAVDLDYLPAIEP